MSQIERQVRRANEILRELDAVYPKGDGVHPQFQLKWSDDLWSLVPRYEVGMNDEVTPVMEHRCQCGVDVRVHSALCSGLTIAKVKLHRVKTFGLEGEFQSYSRVWVLCCWVEPPSKSDWIDAMGTDEDYPQNGRYIPVHRGPRCVVVPNSTTPEQLPDVARLMVKMMREHAETWRAELRKSRDKARALQIPIEDHRGNVVREPDKDAAYWRVLDRVKDKMQRFDADSTVGYTKELKDKEIECQQ